MTRLTYSVTEVADLLGISRSKAYELVAEGSLPVVPLESRRKLVPRRVIEELLGQAVRPAGEASGPTGSPAAAAHREGDVPAR